VDGEQQVVEYREAHRGGIDAPQHRRPADIVAVHQEPVFGRDLYLALSQAKIVLNGAVDMAGEDRGNMRCFETMGCGALLVTDAGNYPAGMAHGITMRIYEDLPGVVRAIESQVADESVRSAIAARGHELVRERYSKARQWQAFQDLVSEL
jgi:spore maturation protein CgeB